MKFWPAVLLLLALAALACGEDPRGNLDPRERGNLEPKGTGAITLSAKVSTPRFVDVKHDRIWSGMILATTVPSPKPLPVELRAVTGKLKNIFGYNQYEIVSSSSEVIDELTENWIVPSPLFSMSVKARRTTSKEARGGYLLNLKLYQEKRELLDLEAKVAPNSPLLIRGPQYGDGQIILILQVEK